MILDFPVKCSQCKRDVPDGDVFYKHPELGFVCMYCPGFEHGGVSVNFTDSEPDDKNPA